MELRSRGYEGEADFLAVRQLLIDSYALTGRIHNWWIDRWESYRFGNLAHDELSGEKGWQRSIRLWETAEGRLVGVVTPENQGESFVQVHPDYRQIENDMLAWMEAHHPTTRPEEASSWPLNTYAYEYDTARADLLRERGYQDLGRWEYTRRRDLDEPIAEAPLPDGYTLQSVDPRRGTDLERRALVCNAAFDSSFHNAESIEVISRAPSYRPELDLVTVAPDGSFASFCTVWYGPENQMGWFEPVGTHPKHQRRGLARAAMTEGLLRLRHLGARRAYVGTGYQSAANQLYIGLGFTGCEIWHHWRKEV